MVSTLIARPPAANPRAANPRAINPRAINPRATNPPVDAVPEFYPYEDTGCEVAGSCLNCPLPQCKYDDPGWYQRNRRLARDLKVFTVMQSEELTVEAAAERFSVTVRTIFRIMRRCREAAENIGEEELEAFSLAK